MPDVIEPPLCVDLDGTLIRGDTLRISLGLLARGHPFQLVALPFVLLRGRPALKRFVAASVLPDPGKLAWRQPVIRLVDAERRKGRRIVLATAADRRIAELVASHLGLFDQVVATDGAANLKGRQKVAALTEALQTDVFDYIGDSVADLPVFAAARLSYLVCPSTGLLARVRQVARVAAVIDA